MNETDPTTANLKRVALQMLPRIITQFDRDPTSSTYGAADRNWWHYKIRDFPSIILQQGAYAIALAAEWPEFDAQRDGMKKLAEAACRFWNRRAIRYGAFEEYYPWESGYPPLAFSTLAVMKTSSLCSMAEASLHAGVAVAARQLQKRFEKQAANQQVAGLAALTHVRKRFPDMVDRNRLASLSERTLALQSDEGWFEEYGGPDLGYLSVTIDCLWDLYDATGEDGYRDAAERALAFMDPFTRLSRGNIGMHNARNTDYIAPYGIARIESDSKTHSATARELLNRVFAAAVQPEHFLHAVDDRYACHYIGHSIVRAVAHLESGERKDVVAKASPPLPHLFHHSRHYLHFPTDYFPERALISLGKGGIITLYDRDGKTLAADFGWSVRDGRQRLVSHWWSPHWDYSQHDDGFTVRGRLVPCREHVSTPMKHLILRTLSLLFGSSIIRRLKDLLIFKRRFGGICFERRITMTDQYVRLSDTLQPVRPDLTPEPAPRASKRHVASADSYHAEDFSGVSPRVSASRDISRSGDKFMAITEWKLDTPRGHRNEHT